MDQLLAEGGVLERLLATGGPLDRLMAEGSSIACCVRAVPLERLVADSGLLDHVLITDATVERLVHPNGTVNRLLTSEGTLPCGRWPTAWSPSRTRPRRSARSSSRSPAWPSGSPAGAGAPADTTVSAAPPGSGGLRPLLTQFLDSTADEQSGAELSRAVSAVLTTALVVTNLIGAAVVLAVIYLILSPSPRSVMPAPYASSTRSSLAVYIVVAVITGALGGRDPRDVVTALNGLFEFGGGLLAVFGAPRRLENHADAGLAAATEIVSATAGADSGSLELGIGLNSGQVVAGKLGGAGRLEYGVIGDPVDVAARVQAHTRETGDALLLTQDIRERLSAPPDGLRRRDGVALRGRSEPIALYAP